MQIHFSISFFSIHSLAPDCAGEVKRACVQGDAFDAIVTPTSYCRGGFVIKLAECALYALLSMALASCADVRETGPNFDQTTQSARLLSRAGECDAAEKEARSYQVSHNTISGTANALTLFGAIAVECRHDRPQGVLYLNLAARYGHDSARQMLEKLKEPVPVADLSAKFGIESLSSADRQLLDSIHLQATPALMRNCTKTGATVTCTTGSN
jgi:hypothetical protein